MNVSRFWINVVQQISDVAVAVGYVPSVGYDPSSVALSSSSRGMWIYLKKCFISIGL